MKQTKRTQVVTTAELGTVADCVELLEWSRDQEGLTVTITARVDGTIRVQAEGFGTPTVYADLGDSICWDGHQFTVDRKEPAHE